MANLKRYVIYFCDPTTLEVYMRIVVMRLYKTIIESEMGLLLVWLKTKSGITIQ